jgi:hypothetical protein
MKITLLWDDTVKIIFCVMYQCYGWINLLKLQGGRIHSMPLNFKSHTFVLLKNTEVREQMLRFYGSERQYKNYLIVF